MMNQFVRHRPFTAGNGIDLLVNGQEVFENGIFPLVESAQESIHISMFQWRWGDVGNHLAQVLAEKARQGVKINIMVDSEGARQFASNASYKLLQKLEQVPGITILRSSLSCSLTGNGKIHHKMLIADGKTAILGSTNIRDESLRTIHDLMLRVKGPAIDDIENEFEINWQQLGGRLSPPKLREQPRIQEGAEIKVVQGMGKAHPEIIALSHDLIREAKNSILLEEAYITDPMVQKLLVEQARRGLRVTIIIPSVNDWKGLPSLAMENFTARLLGAGGQVFLYPGRLHCKALLVDGETLFTGSAAYMGSPLQDLNLLIRDSKTIQEFNQRLFETDIAASQELRSRDLKNRSRWRKFISSCCEHAFSWFAYSAK